MLSAVVLGALLSGCVAQPNLVPVQTGDVCQGTALQIPYRYCGSLRQGTGEPFMNIFWTYVPGTPPDGDGQLNMLVEGADGNWLSAGFGVNVGQNQMRNARAAFGCHNVPNAEPVLDNHLQDKNIDAVRAGLGMGNQSLANTLVMRRNGVCGFRSERPATPPMLAALNQPLLNIVNGTANVFIGAAGTPDNAVAVHNVGRAFAMIDFVQGTADGLGMVANFAANPDMPMGDNSVASLKLSSVVVAAAASMFAALW